MKIKIYREVYLLRSSIFREIEIECKGNGTKKDPAILEPSEDLPDDFHINKSDIYLHVKNCDNHLISVNTCKNITIEGCNVVVFILINCSDVNLIKNTISKRLRLQDCKDIIIDQSNIEKLVIDYSHSNIIRNCTINHLAYHSSSSNIFEKNIIPENQLSKLNKSPLMKFFEKWGIEHGIIIMVLFAIIAIVLDNLILLNYQFPILTLIALPVLSLSVIVPIISRFIFKLRSKKHRKNSIKGC
ncbi:MAG: hypothetical protein ACFFG0_40730 [Candidatus Thorarchaeota archaeon]